MAIEPKSAFRQSQAPASTLNERPVAPHTKMLGKFFSLISDSLIFWSQLLYQFSQHLRHLQRRLERTGVVSCGSYVWVQDLPGGLVKRLNVAQAKPERVPLQRPTR